MSGAYPAAGSTYTYARRAINPHVGFHAGWAMMLDYFLIPLLSIIYAALTAARLVPQIPYMAWAIFFTVSRSLVNPNVTGWSPNPLNFHRARWLCVRR